MAQGINRRSRVVIEPKLQFRYLVLPLIVTVTTSICLFALFAIQAESLKSLASPDEGLQDEIARMQLLVGVVVAAVLLGHVAFVVVLGLRSSHKVVGPLYRLKQAMREVTAGNLKVRIKLREGDQLTDVAELFNQMVAGLRPPAEEAEGEARPEVSGAGEPASEEPVKPEVVEAPEEPPEKDA